MGMLKKLKKSVSRKGKEEMKETAPPKKEETKKEEPKKEDPKKEDPKKEEPKEAAPAAPVEEEKPKMELEPTAPVEEETKEAPPAPEEPTTEETKEGDPKGVIALDTETMDDMSSSAAAEEAGYNCCGISCT